MSTSYFFIFLLNKYIKAAGSNEFCHFSLLWVKGLDSNKLIDENNIRYLVFSLANNKEEFTVELKSLY